MPVSFQSPPMVTPSMSHVDSNSDRSYQTNTSSIFPTTSIPKNFNVPFAIQHGYFRCVRYLLELSHDPNERDSQLHTPLILCSYVENDRWSLSIAQNLLEKGAKIALADNARRNAMHHACALQRIYLVQLYLSCLEFDIEAKDCDGNTFLHYAAITGNCEIAELLIKISDKMGVRLDQYVNREGCSAAVLALRYGHIECANQITHRDWDEFFVVPRPPSVYESPPKTDINYNLSTTTTTTSKKKSETSSRTSPTTKTNLRPSTLSFGLLKIIFNESDAKYSSHLAKLCDECKQTHHHRRLRKKNPETSSIITKLNQTKSITTNGTYHSSAEAIVNGLYSSKPGDEHKIYTNSKEKVNHTGRLPPRAPSSMQQHASTKDSLPNNDGTKPKTNTSIIRRRILDSPVNHYEHTASLIFEPPRITKLQRPKTPISTLHKISDKLVDIPSQLSARKLRPSSSYKKPKKKPLSTNRPKSASYIPNQQHSNLTFESSTYSKTLFAGRPLSAVLQNHHRRSPVQQIVDPSCSIREARGAASRYNNPEELFGIKPEELFGTSDNQPKLNKHHKTNNNTYSTTNNLQQQQQQQQQYMYQQDIDKLADLYAIQHTPSYRPAAPQIKLPTHRIGGKQSEKNRKRSTSSRDSISSIRTPTNNRLSTLAALNISRRFAENRRSTLKVVHT